MNNALIFPMFLMVAFTWFRCVEIEKKLDKPVPIFTNEKAADAMDCLAREQGNE